MDWGSVMCVNKMLIHHVDHLGPKLSFKSMALLQLHFEDQNRWNEFVVMHSSKQTHGPGLWGVTRTRTSRQNFLLSCPSDEKHCPRRHRCQLLAFQWQIGSHWIHLSPTSIPNVQQNQESDFGSPSFRSEPLAMHHFSFKEFQTELGYTVISWYSDLRRRSSSVEGNCFAQKEKYQMHTTYLWKPWFGFQRKTLST